MWVALFSPASVINQVKGPNQERIKQVIKFNLVMKTLPGQKILSGEFVPVIFQVAGPEKLFSEFIR